MGRNKGVLPFRQALALLTILPVSARTDGMKMERVMLWFPVVGAGIGAAAGALFQIVSAHWPDPVAALLAVGLLALLTGGLHLDGFADTLDGLAAWKSREETLRIMQDSRIGVMAAAGLFLLLCLQWALLQSLPTDRVLGSLVTACALSRAAILFSGQTAPYVPGKNGLGRLVTDHRSKPALAGALLLAVAISAVCVGPWLALAGGLAACGIAWCLNRVFVKRLGGITGDTLGAVNEGVAAGLLLLLAAN